MDKVIFYSNISSDVRIQQNPLRPCSCWQGAEKVYERIGTLRSSLKNTCVTIVQQIDASNS